MLLHCILLITISVSLDIDNLLSFLIKLWTGLHFHFCRFWLLQVQSIVTFFICQ